MVLIEIAVDLESQLEIVSEVPGNSSDSFQTDGYHTFRRWFALLREERCALAPPRSTEEEQALAMMRSPAALRKSSSSAPHDATLCLEPVQASISPPVTPIRTVTPKSDVPPHQPLDLAEVLAKLAAVLDEPRSLQSLEKEFEADMGRAATETEYAEVLRTYHHYPGVIAATHGTEVREDLATLTEEFGSGERRPEEYSRHQCGHLRRLRFFIVMVTGDHDEGRAMKCVIRRKIRDAGTNTTRPHEIPSM